jgi:wyosine [tRNA(Phe)-imidazoG37] synthetase (radical SAM superfamily)
MTRLSTEDHDRGAQGLTWVYAVVSRRARGVSVGINLQPNNACNWRCVYCQVPGLVVGKSPPVDLAALQRELGGLLGEIESGAFFERHVDAGARRLADIAFSGNGEPTASPQFLEAVEIALAARARVALVPPPALRLITNGALLHTPRTQAALARLAGVGGEVWFKLDRATDAGLREVNSCATGAERHFENLALSSRLAPTWIQTCLFALDGAAPPEVELAALEQAFARAARLPVPPRGVLLYGLARPSQQPEAARLCRLDESWMRACGERLARSGLPVEVHP